MPIAAGTVLGHYKITSQLGFGGMGEVYLAQDLNLRRSVALKILTVDLEKSPHGMRRFVQEARTASALRHPNIAHIYEISEADQVSFIAMEYIDGVTLRQHEPVGLGEAIDIAIEVASALIAAHSMGIVHRDLKPENVMISREGYVKVLDFGLAKIIATGEQAKAHLDGSTVSTFFTDPGSVVGTVTYMSPEQARGTGVDPRADLWSLGAILYELIAGRAPFEAATVSDLVVMILHQEPPPLARFSRDVPEAVEWFVSKALSKNPEGRHQTAKEMLSDLRRLKHRFGTGRSDTQSESQSMSSAAGKSGSGSQTEPPAPAMSSVEYILSGITTHKKAAVTTLVVLLLAAVAGLFGIFYLARSWRANSTPVSRSLSRLTFGAGLQNGPTWSPDGRFIAYSSDRNGPFDIWVQPVSGGDPVQVTHSTSHNWQPDWSPDGNSIVFRSEAEGGGLYVVPAFGGRERKIASFGYSPRWSPDGWRILCLSPGDDYFDFPRMFIVKLDGSPPVEIPTSTPGQERWVKQQLVAWHPDGKRISFLANDGSFWTGSVIGGKPVQAEVSASVKRQLRETAVQLGRFCWAPSGAALYFEGTSKSLLNLWKITVDPKTLAWIGGPERLTTGLGPDTEIALSKDRKRLAFATEDQVTRIWSIPFDSLTGRIKGAGQPITAADLDESFPDLSPDGAKLVFAARRRGMDRQELWQQALKDSTTKFLASDEYSRFMPRWSPDGKYLAYTRYRAIGQETERPYVIVVMPADGGQEQVLTSLGAWRDYVYDWSPDGQWVLGSTNRTDPNRWEISLFPISAAPHAESAMRLIASDPSSDLWAPRFSPDGRWISFLSQKNSEPGVSVLNVVASSGGAPIRITDDQSWSDKPRWSLDGKTIYFISNRGSMFLNVWGIHFDPSTGKSVGDPFKITTFASPGQLISTQISTLEMSIDQNRLCLPVTQVSGSIWILGDVDR